jgi:hypothetical protein
MLRAIVGCIVFASMCSLATAADQPARPPASVLDYSVWSSHKVGATATHEIKEVAGDKTTKTREVYTLTSVEPDKVVVERVADRHDLDPKTTPVKSTNILTAPKDVPPPSPDSTTEESDEDVKIGDKTYKCHVYKVTTKRDVTTRVWTVWLNPEIPGSNVKQTTEMTTGDKTISSSTDTLTEFHAGK